MSCDLPLCAFHALLRRSYLLLFCIPMHSHLLSSIMLIQLSLAYIREPLLRAGGSIARAVGSTHKQ